MSDYVTDPELLNQLNSADNSGYVTDPELLSQLNTPTNTNTDKNILAAEASPGARLAANYYNGTNGGVPGAVYREAKDLVGIVGKSTPAQWADAAGHPIKFTQDAIKALAERYSGGAYNKPIGETVGTLMKTGAPNLVRGVGSALGGAVTAPENALMLPYNMAAYEQAKIRANPTAPEYVNNPYAMQVRGQAPTQAAAGAINQRNAVANFNTAGNPAINTMQFQQLKQQQDAQANAVLSQPPTAQNFMARMQALAHKYGTAMPNL